MDKTDFKKQDKSFYFPPTEPTIITIPKMNFFAAAGIGDPNKEGGDYQQALSLLYALTFTIKMSKMSSDTPDGYHDYAVPPLEGLWDIDLIQITDFGIADKSQFKWLSLIRQPDFVTEKVFAWAKAKLAVKKPELDLSKASYLSFEEGLCAQIMHIGPYDTESATIQKLDNFIINSNHRPDFNNSKHRLHHEIYLSDPRRSNPNNLKTVIRHPIKSVK